MTSSTAGPPSMTSSRSFSIAAFLTPGGKARTMPRRRRRLALPRQGLRGGARYGWGRPLGSLPGRRELLPGAAVGAAAAAAAAAGPLGAELVVQGLGIDTERPRRLSPMAFVLPQHGLDVLPFHLFEGQPGGQRALLPVAVPHVQGQVFR